MSVDTVNAHRVDKGEEMAKIGRNERCPCGSGKKYKRCCGLKSNIAVRPVRTGDERVTLMYNVGKVQQAAVEKRDHIIEIGVFILFSTSSGDSWLLELTDSDCIQLAEKGEKLAVPINESSEVIEVDWTHTFSIRDRQFEIVNYKDKNKEILEDCPTKEIAAAIRRIKKKFPGSQLDSVHLDPQTAEQMN